MSQKYVIEREDGCLWTGSQWIFAENTADLEKAIWSDTLPYGPALFHELLTSVARDVGGDVYTLEAWSEDGWEALDDISATLKAEEGWWERQYALEPPQSQRF